MDKQELFNIIADLIKEKKTLPKMLTFVELRKNVKGSKKELNKAFRELQREGKIRTRLGKNSNLIEIL